MSTFSLLQITLDQSIERDSFLDAATDSVTRADLDQVYRDLYGIVISNLPREDAVKLQVELKNRNFPTELVADVEIPVLPQDFQVQRVDMETDWLRFTDAMGRESLRSLSDLVFVSGGFLTNTKLKSDYQLSSRASSGDHSSRIERSYPVKEGPEFRVEFFFLSDPYRLKLSLTELNTIFYRQTPLRLSKRGPVNNAIVDLRTLLPTDRLSAGLLHPGKSYPSPKAYLEEIRWHFYQLRKTG